MKKNLRRAATMLGASVLLAGTAGVAVADNVQSDDVSANGTTSIALVGGSGSTTIDFRIIANGSEGCNATAGSPGDLSVAISGGPSGGLTASPSTLRFTRCAEGNQKNEQAMTFTATKVGDYSVTTIVADAEPGNGYANLTFVIKVSGPSNTSPTVAVTGVAHEATYELGAVPTAGCQVTDAEDGASTEAATLSTVSGPLADYGIGEQTATCTHTDSGGLTATSAAATYTIEDTTAPTLAVPADQVLEATGTDGAVASWSAPTAEDIGTLAAGSPTCDADSGDTFDLGVTTVTCTATDRSGNSASGGFTITVQDTEGPVLTGGSDATKEATGPTTPVTFIKPTAQDTYSGDLEPVCEPDSGSGFSVGSTTVTCTATDSSDNSSSVTLTVTVTDTTGPTLTLPTDLTSEATGPNGAVVSWSASAADLVDGARGVSCLPANGSTFAIGTSIVTCTSEDSRGNLGSGSFSVTVADTTAPALTVPEDRTVEATGPSGAEVTFAATATDVVDTDVTVSCIPASGSMFALGSTQVNCTAEDDHGNKDTDSFAVAVVDTTAPVVTVPAEDVVAEATGPGGAVASFEASASDIVDGELGATCGPASGSVFPLGRTTVTCIATDEAGNTGSASFDVRVVDTTAPDLTVPADKTVEATGPGGASVSWAASAQDLVDGAVTPECTPASPQVFALGEHTVTCTATDGRDNSVQKSFKVDVVDTTAPVLDLPDDIVTNATSASGRTVTWSASASDLVDGAVEVVCAPASGSRFAPGTTAVTCSATDQAGNTGTDSFTVTVSFGWNGFFAPVNNPGSDSLKPVVNTIKGGQSVPMKWTIPDGNGGWISDLGVVAKVRQAKVDCSAGAVLDDIEAPTSGASGLHYDSSANQYVYNWQSPKGAGLCYRVAVDLTDGSTHYALFKTR